MQEKTMFEFSDLFHPSGEVPSGHAPGYLLVMAELTRIRGYVFFISYELLLKIFY